jgi:hypothetical protein
MRIEAWRDRGSNYLRLRTRLKTRFTLTTFVELARSVSLSTVTPSLLTTMMRTTDFRSRFVVLALLVFAICGFLLYQAPLSHLSRIIQTEQQQGNTGGAVLTGHAIAPKLGNATAKYVSQIRYAHLGSSGRGSRRSTDMDEQGRTWSRGMESPSHDICSLPREAYRRGEGSASVIRTPFPAFVSLVRSTPRDAAAEVTRILILLIAENALNISDKSLLNTHHKCLHEPQQPCGAVSYTTKVRQ